MRRSNVNNETEAQDDANIYIYINALNAFIKKKEKIEYVKWNDLLPTFLRRTGYTQDVELNNSIRDVINSGINAGKYFEDIASILHNIFNSPNPDSVISYNPGNSFTRIKAIFRSLKKDLVGRLTENRLVLALNCLEKTLLDCQGKAELDQKRYKTVLTKRCYFMREYALKYLNEVVLYSLNFIRKNNLYDLNIVSVNRFYDYLFSTFFNALVCDLNFYLRYGYTPESTITVLDLIISRSINYQEGITDALASVSLKHIMLDAFQLLKNDHEKVSNKISTILNSFQCVDIKVAKIKGVLEVVNDVGPEATRFFVADKILNALSKDPYDPGLSKILYALESVSSPQHVPFSNVRSAPPVNEIYAVRYRFRPSKNNIELPQQAHYNQISRL